MVHGDSPVELGALSCPAPANTKLNRPVKPAESSWCWGPRSSQETPKGASHPGQPHLYSSSRPTSMVPSDSVSDELSSHSRFILAVQPRTGSSGAGVIGGKKLLGWIRLPHARPPPSVPAVALSRSQAGCSEELLPVPASPGSSPARTLPLTPLASPSLPSQHVPSLPG